MRGESLYVANCQTCHGGATGDSMMDIPPPHNGTVLTREELGTVTLSQGDVVEIVRPVGGG